MNTGIQRSGATPFGASTTTSPAGLESFGKAQQRKDITAIAVAHHVPYVAQGVGSHWFDLSEKVRRAVAADGPSFLNVLTDCPVGWGHEARFGPRILDAAVESRFWPLYEVVDGAIDLPTSPDRRPDRGGCGSKALRAPPPTRERRSRRRDPAARDADGKTCCAFLKEVIYRDHDARRHLPGSLRRSRQARADAADHTIESTGRTASTTTSSCRSKPTCRICTSRSSGILEVRAPRRAT
jgi:hypothetical protein